MPVSAISWALDKAWERTRAARRWSGDKRTLREDIARPSGSRTVSQGTISVGMSRSRARRADDLELLVVFEAEVGAVGLGDVEELGDHGGDALEVAGARRAFELVGEAADDDHRVEAALVHLGHVGLEDGIDAILGGDSLVASGVAGVLLEVFDVVKLGRVDEQGHHGDIVFGFGSAQEGAVAFVERAHGGNEADGFAGAPGGGDLGAEGGDGGMTCMAGEPIRRVAPPSL